jgi:hypothetical protein
VSRVCHNQGPKKTLDPIENSPYGCLVPTVLSSQDILRNLYNFMSDEARNWMQTAGYDY